jgi:ABC-type transport system involved in multi-copper enzyme maturation permease subunit
VIGASVDAADNMITPGFFKRLFMNPLAVRELRVACRSWKLVIILSAYLLIQGAIFSIWLYAASDSQGLYEDPTSIGRGLFITMSIVLSIVVMLVFPAFSSTAIASEHEKKSFDLLMLTPLAPWEIASGKFFAAALQSSIFLVATVPLFAMAGLFGGIDPAIFFVVLWVLILFSIFISFIGVYASSLVQKAIPAVLITYLFAFILGLALLVVFILLTFALGLILMAMPGFADILNPTTSEAIYYIASLTATCGLYCTFLFLSTTNRLKPSSHNKSTGLRILWTVAALLLPAQVAVYFLVVRTPYHDSSFAGLIVATIYFALVFMIPALTGPAEAPVPSRRVRREMAKMPESVMNAGGKIFFPGADRGALHAALVIVLGLSLMAGAAFVCYGKLNARLDDRAALMQDYTQVRALDSSAFALTGATPFNPTLAAIAALPDSEMREAVETFRNHEYAGYLALLVLLGVTLLTASQATWRLTLSGISKTLAGVLAGLMIVVWLVVPYIAQAISGMEGESENHMISQLSPIQGSINAVNWGKQKGRAAITPGQTEAAALSNRASRLQSRWLTFGLVTAAMGGALLASNLVSRRKVLAQLARLEGGSMEGHAPEPATATPEQLQQVLAAVTAPQPPAFDPGPPQYGGPGAPPPQS